MHGCSPASLAAKSCDRKRSRAKSERPSCACRSGGDKTVSLRPVSAASVDPARVSNRTVLPSNSRGRLVTPYVQHLFTVHGQFGASSSQGTPMSDQSIASTLRIPSVFYGLEQMPETVAALRSLVANAVGVGEPDSPWFIADNLITFGHTHGFLTEPRFIAAVNAEHPAHDELSIIWRTHTLCWAADNCLGVAGDY